MRVLKMFLPHFTIALAVALTVVVILDVYNPMMGFLMGKPFRILVILEVICSLATSVYFLFRSHREEKKAIGKYEKT